MDDTRAGREQDIALGGLQAVFDANIIGIAISGADERILAANDSYLRATGFSREDLEAGRVNWRSVTPPEFIPVDEAALEEYARTGVSSPFEKAYVHADGRRVPVVLASAAVPGTGGMATFVLDISAQKAAEEALRRSEERYRELFDAAAEATLVIDQPGFRIVDANRMATALYGYAREELLGLTASDLSTDRDACATFLSSVVRGPGDDPVVGEHVHRRKDGSQFPAEFTARRLSRDDGRVLLVSCRDLTERRAAEEAIRQRALILNAAPFGVTVHALDGGLLYANLKAAAMHGYSLDEFMASPIASLEMPEEAASFAARIQDVLEHDMTTFEVNHRRKDGSLLPLQATVARATWNGGDALLAILLDVTERRQAASALLESRSELEEAQRVAHVGSFTWDARTGEVRWSAELCRIFGLPDGQAPTTAAEADGLFGLETAARLQEAVSRSEISGKPYELDATITRADGTPRHVIQRAEVVRDPDGVFAGARGTVADVTELRQAQAVVDQAQRVEMIGRLAGGIAHDFNNLLTAIGGHAEFLLASFEPEDPRREDVAPILDASARAADLTRQLLAFGRREVLHPTVVVPGDVIERLRPMLRSSVPADVDLVIRADPARSAVRVDRDRLGNAVINLVLNARDAMPAGGTLTVGTEAVRLDAGDPRLRPPADPGDYVRLWVADTGSGIHADLLPHIFEPFFTTKRLGRGSGLGLPSVDGFLAQSGGWVTVDTEPGVGSVFSLFLAIELQAEAYAAVGRASTRPADVALRRTILVVDDEPEVRAITGRLLRQLGYDVVEAANGEEALGAWSRQHVDVLVSDVVLPGLSGPDLAARCRVERPELPVLLVSGYARESLLSEGRAVAGSAFLAKPFSRDQLAMRLRQLLEPQG